MFERFTDRARRVVVLAQEEARILDHNHIGTEHVLLGVLHEGEGIGARALASLGISLDEVRAQVGAVSGASARGPVQSHIPFTRRAKKALELSLREALQLGHNYIGTEHILLGLVREGEGVAGQVLVKLGAGRGAVRAAVLGLVEADEGPGERVEHVPDRSSGVQRIFAAPKGAGRGGVEGVPADTRTPLRELARIAASPSAAGSELRAAGIDEAALADAEPAPVDPRAPVGTGDLIEHLAQTLANALGGPDARAGDDHVLVVLLSAHHFGLAEIVRGLGADPDALRRSALSRL